MYKKLLIFIPHINVGGVEKNFFIITNYLAKKLNSNVSVITVNNEFTKKLNKKIKIISPKSNKWENSSMYTKYTISIFLLIRTLISDRNYLIFSFQANWYAIIITKLFGLKIVTRSNTAPEGWSKGIIKNFLYKLVINFSDKIIVNSNEFKASLKKYFNVNSICIYNPLDKSNAFQLSKRVKKFDFFTKKKNLKIINIGRFTDQKDQITLLKAVNLIKNKISLQLTIVGRGKEEENLKKFINNNNLNGLVRLVNFTNNPYNLINSSDIFILSSLYEGLPNVLLESQVLKKFIISTNCPTGPKEILMNGKAGFLFKPKDYKNLAKLIIYAYKNKSKLKKMSNLGYKNLFRFDYNTNIKKYYSTINSIL